MQKFIILCDLDGTLCDNDHRQHHIEQDSNDISPDFKKDWKTFFSKAYDDPPIVHMLHLLDMLNRDLVEIWITTGRPEDCKYDTIDWLRKHNVHYDKLIMRPKGDHTDDGILKPSWLIDGTIPKDRVLFALDDRQRVVDGWRKAGIPCLQVAPGDF